jgi:15-cis-phytoene synthase
VLSPGDFETVRTAARQGEPDRYLAALLAAEPQRTALLVIAAFSAELRRIPAHVTEPTIGEIRLQWWRDAIEGFAAANKTGNPIADALGETVRQFNLPAALLIAMTEARAFDLYHDPMADDAAFAGYLSKTEGVPSELAFRILASRGPDAAESGALTTAARAYGLARLTGELPHWLARGRCPVSGTTLSSAGATLETLLSGEKSAVARVLIEHLSRDAQATYVAAKAQIATWPRAHRLALLPLCTVPPYLKAARSPKRHPLREPVELAPLTRVWRIAAGQITGRL